MAQQSARLRAPGDFGTVLLQARLAQGLSQTELAQRLGIPQGTISELENGKSTIFLRRLLAVARETGIDFHATWDDDNAPRS